MIAGATYAQFKEATEIEFINKKMSLVRTWSVTQTQTNTLCIIIYRMRFYLATDTTRNTSVKVPYCGTIGSARVYIRTGHQTILRPARK